MSAETDHLKARWLAAGIQASDEEAQQALEGVRRLRQMADMARQQVRRETEPATVFWPPVPE